ncbi:Ubiquitin-associated (UBA) protein [Raphanus sativus]|nr:Ubiquitin-associated (UBA) protein [Raphanus sativus]
MENVKDKDVEEDLGTELSPVPITTTLVGLEIILDDCGSGTHVWILVRLDHTVRDIRNKIAVFRPEDKRDYYLKSDTGVEYRDLDTTVHRITSDSRGSTILYQLFSS